MSEHLADLLPARRLLPETTRPARLAPLARLPVFLGLEGRRAVVVGGGAAAAWKAELLAATGAWLEIYSPAPDAETEALAAAQPERIAIHRRTWRSEDLDGAAIAIAEAEGEEAGRFAAASRARGVLVNVIDQPDFCDFQFGSIVNRSPVVIGISTDGAAPILAQAIRQRIEAILPRTIGRFAEAAKSFRERLGGLIPDRNARRAFWELFVDRVFKAQNDEDAELERLVREVLSRDTPGGDPPRRVGEVVLVGAGPGDPELLTMRGLRELQAADVVVYDRLVTPEILELARREARRIRVGKEGHGAACRQDDISALIVDLALEGKRVVRLKGGDPAIFGRAGEEAAACREAGVPCRIVPGITSASAAAASLGLSLTHRDHAQRLQFVTGHDRHGHLPDNLDIDALADPHATTIVYMARRTASRLAAAMLARGLKPGTPVAIASDVSRPDEQTRQTTLGALAEAPEMPNDRPVLVLIGKVFGAVSPALETAAVAPSGLRQSA